MFCVQINIFWMGNTMTVSSKVVCLILGALPRFVNKTFLPLYFPFLLHFFFCLSYFCLSIDGEKGFYIAA